jgi:hypothetical protein
MRHINQMTREELNSKIIEVNKARESVVSTDSIRWNELYRLSEELRHEATRRADSLPLGATAGDFSIAM